MQHGRLTIYSISLVLFFPPLAALSTSCQPVQQRNNKEKWSQATLTYLCIYFCIYSLPPPSPHPTTTTFRVPSCGLPFDPTVSSITIVLLLLRNQTKHKMYTEQIHIPALSFMCPKVKIFPKLKGSEKLNSFPLFLSILPKSIPDYAVVVEY